MNRAAVNPRPTTGPDEWIETTARTHPQRAFLKTPAGREFSYGSLREQSGRFASALLRRGVVPATALRSKWRNPWRRCCSTSRACDWVRCSCPSIRRIRPTKSTISCATRSRDVAVVRPPDRARSSRWRGASRRCARRDAGRGGRGIAARAGAANHGETPIAAEPAGASSLAAIVYTSGTTGRSKGAMLTRANLASNARRARRGVAFYRQRCVAAHPAAVSHSRFVRRDQHRARLGSSLLLLPKFDAASALKHLPEATRVHGRADALHAPAAAGRR